MKGREQGWGTVWCTKKPQKTANVQEVQGLAELIPVYAFVSVS